MDDLLREFLQETAESIDVVDVELVKLEQDPNDRGVLDNIFRLVHTIKGTCGFLGLPRLEKVAHASENVLVKFRDGELKVTPDYVTVILESLDRIKDILAGIEQLEEEPEGEDQELIGRLDAIAEGKGVKSSPPPKQEQKPKQEAKPEPAPAPAPPSGKAVYDPGLERELKEGEVSLAELDRIFNETPGPEAADAGKKAQKGKSKDRGEDSLYVRFGGEDAVSVAGHLLLNRLTADERLKTLFSGDAGQQNARLAGLLTALLKDEISNAEVLADSLLQGAGFDDAAFDKTSALFADVCNELKLDAETRDDAVMALELVRDIMKEASGRKAPAAAAAATKAKAGVEDHKAGSGSDLASQSIRVSVDLLEDLMNMVSELVLTRNQLMQLSRELSTNQLSVPLQRLSQCTTELQEGIMKTRMQPIGNAWAKLPRIIRDLSLELGKKIDLVMVGQETELDRQVLELIKDPLTHMVRNSADHGIEMPAVRLAAGKPETGAIRLNAYHEGGHIIIEISDDGAGLNASKLKAKIVEKGLASQAEVDGMPDSQVQKYIFHPGFSTAEKITNISGRGVGMDVVRTNIEKIGGNIDLSSSEGKGTTFLIKIPLTLAIVAALIVEASGERFAIPQISVLELVRASGDSEHRIEMINATPVLRLRSRLLPLVYLRDVLGFPRKDEDGRGDFIIVAQVGSFTFGIVVDRVFDTEEIVVKPVAPILKHLNIYSGNTILGDGSVIMILDPNGIANATTQVTDNQEEEAAEAAASEAAKAAASTKEALLVFRAGSASPKAVPLALVARLEEIEANRIEMSDGRLMVQYRGTLMPVLPCNDQVNIRNEGIQPVVVFADGDKHMGLAVDEILDIVEDELDIDLNSDTRGIIGSAIILDRATEIIDVAHYVNQAFEDWLGSRDQQDRVSPRKGTRILVIDDSSFFRNMLKPLLTAAGYAVTMATDGAQAIALREKGVDFDAIVSDIEMPNMDGYEFARQVRAEGRWAQLPLIALSSHASPRDFERGREAGYSDYVAKFDKDSLLSALTQQLRLKGDAA